MKIKLLLPIFLLCLSFDGVASTIIFNQSPFSWPQFSVAWKNPFTYNWSLSPRTKQNLRTIAIVGGLAIIGYSSVRTHIDKMLDTLEGYDNEAQREFSLAEKRQIGNFSLTLKSLPRFFFSKTQLDRWGKLFSE